MEKCALLVIDMQNAYFNNDALEKKRQQLIASCNELIAYAQAQNIPVFNIRTTHKRDRSTWTRNMLDDKVGYLFEGDEDARNVEGLNIQNATEVIKTRDSAFRDTILESSLRTLGVSELILCGVSTHTCVFMTAADAYALGFAVTVAKAGVAGHDDSQHARTLSLLAEEYRQRIATNQQIVAD